MSNEYTYDVIDKLNSIDWAYLNDLRMPITWQNDITRLNADNLNTLTNSIKDIRGVVSTNNEILKEAILYLASKWDSDGTYKSDLAVKGDILVSADKDIKLGDVSLSTYLQDISSTIENNSSSMTAVQDKITEQSSTISTMSDTIAALQLRIEALENPIVPDTEDPENANLN